MPKSRCFHPEIRISGWKRIKEKPIVEDSPNNNQRKKKGILILCAIGVIGLIAGTIFYRYSQIHITTDDAYVTGSIYSLSFRIPGTVVKGHVHDNQQVEAGQVIAGLDPTDYEVAYKQAQANLGTLKARWVSGQMAVPLESDQTRARINESTAGQGAWEKNGLEAQEQLKRAQEETRSLKALLDKATLDRDRFQNLIGLKAISQQQFDEALTQYQVAEARFKGGGFGRSASLAKDY
ncbi:MAG: hypothetical protein C0407_04625 [Desulfobacca sp.]|nr:hypothetical protein [Desulfobacca sp.]